MQHPLAVVHAKDKSALDHVREDRHPLGSGEHGGGDRFHRDGEKLIEGIAGPHHSLRFAGAAGLGELRVGLGRNQAQKHPAGHHRRTPPEQFRSHGESFRGR